MKEKQLYLLQVQYNGITLNNQDIDLMLIAGSNNIHELKLALSKIDNLLSVYGQYVKIILLIYTNKSSFCFFILLIFTSTNK